LLATQGRQYSKGAHMNTDERIIQMNMSARTREIVLKAAKDRGQTEEQFLRTMTKKEGKMEIVVMPSQTSK
jgi:hypothetical protein